MKILETHRLILRRLLPNDLDSLFALYSDPEIRRYFPEGTLTYAETREELEWFLNGHPTHPELGLWATLHKQTGEFMGRCGLLPWTIEQRPEVEVAYLLAKTYCGISLQRRASAIGPVCHSNTPRGDGRTRGRAPTTAGRARLSPRPGQSCAV